MKGNWHFSPSFVLQVVISLGLTEMGVRTEDPPLFIINGNGHFLPSFVLQVMRAGSKTGVRDAGEGAGARADARIGVGVGVGAIEGALEPPLNPSHLSLQSTQGFGVP